MDRNPQRGDERVPAAHAAPVREPPAPAPSAGLGAVLGGGIADALTADHVLAMQRTAGNRATTAFLAAGAQPPEDPRR